MNIITLSIMFVFLIFECMCELETFVITGSCYRITLDSKHYYNKENDFKKSIKYNTKKSNKGRQIELHSTDYLPCSMAINRRAGFNNRSTTQ